MKIPRKISTLLPVLFLWIGCATHPTISPELAPVGKTTWGYTLAVENAIPMVWFRRGLSDKSDIGFRIGFPLYGTGIDYTRIVMQKDKKWDAINLSFALNPNKNMDFTYYKFKKKLVTRTRPVKKKVEMLKWKGFKFMYIPQNGIRGTSLRFGLLMGGKPSKRIGYEIGYYHDFASMPFSEILNFSWDPTSPEVQELWGSSYEDYPVSRGGMPSEYSRATGLSFQVMFYLGGFKEKKYLPE